MYKRGLNNYQRLFGLNERQLARRVIYIHYIPIDDTGMSAYMAFSPNPLSTPNSRFLQLLSAYYATLMFLGMLIFFHFPVYSDYFIA